MGHVNGTCPEKVDKQTKKKLPSRFMAYKSYFLILKGAFNLFRCILIASNSCYYIHKEDLLIKGDIFNFSGGCIHTAFPVGHTTYSSL